MHLPRFASALLPVLLALPAAAQISASGFQGATASVSNNGTWTVAVPGPQWQFAGTVGTAALAPHIVDGVDSLGAYEEVAFSYAISAAPRTAAIRVYRDRPVILFNITHTAAASNTAPFPNFAAYPKLPHLNFNGMFAPPDFTNYRSDSPWAFFDSAANTFILSPAANYMTAQMEMTSARSIRSGVSGAIASLPSGFTHSTALVFGKGINATFDAWGQAITELGGKKRPSNSADILLRNISYWTDNGATYYYNGGDSGYVTTLEAIRAEFAGKGVALGSLQIDSWWYPKGPDNTWSSSQGIWTYTADSALFPQGLAAFEAGLKVPITTHARWIDAASPYRSLYNLSNNVATDPAYWEATAAYIKAGGAAIYEQDWLGLNAEPVYNLTDPNAFLGNMSASMASRGIDIQYCMALPKHFLQSSLYSNVTSIRTSEDRFGSDRWTHFLYSSRFASALGLWPFSDVFMSTETGNMIAAVLSAGPVGVGDPLGSLSKLNLSRAARPDGVLVKPDFPATPIDSVIAADAAGIDVPMLAAAYSEFGGLRAHYLFAYPRATNSTLTIDPTVFGITGAGWLYNYLTKAAVYLPAGTVSTVTLPAGASYFILIPVGPSGIGLLGDTGHIATLGKQRIAALADNGTVQVTVNFAAGETSRTLTGFSAELPAISRIGGTHKAPTWDETTQTFTVAVRPAANGQARLTIALPGSAGKPTPTSPR